MTENDETCELTLWEKNIFSCHRLQSSPSSYFSATYMTILSVFQGIMIARVFQSFFEKKISVFFNLLYLNHILYHLLILLIIVTVWHNYMNHHQFIVWQISWKDTVIVTLFGAIESFLVYYAIVDNCKHTQKSFYYIVLGMLGVGVIGLFAYHHAHKEMNEKYISKLYQEHYKCDDKKCGLADDLWWLLVGFEDYARFLAFLFVYMFFIAFFILNSFESPFNSDRPLFEFILLSSSTILVAIFLWATDLKRIIGSKENCLRKLIEKKFCPDMLYEDLSERNKS
jgi:hypothetical protein